MPGSLQHQATPRSIRWRLLLVFVAVVQFLFVVWMVRHVYVDDDNDNDNRRRPLFRSLVAREPELGTKTQFTDHVVGIIKDLSSSSSTTTIAPANMSTCHVRIHFVVETPYSQPKVVCDVTDSRRNNHVDCELMRFIFRNRKLAHNITIGFDHADSRNNPNNRQPCLTNASPKAVLCVPNMQDRRYMWFNRRKTRYGWDQPPKETVPWDQRDPIPVFRGAGWLLFGADKLDSFNQKCAAKTFSASKFIRHLPPAAQPRFKVVQYSMQHPNWLNARLSNKTQEKMEEHVPECAKARERIPELAKLLTYDKIEKKDYFSKYQVALVLRGIGPAYRVNRHFMAGTAVILQYCELQEWYIPYLKPYIHFIPLAEDLGNLTQVLGWVRDNPIKVKEIADNGFAFYEKYLSFAKHTEHFHELLWRFSEYNHSGGAVATYKVPDTLATAT